MRMEVLLRYLDSAAENHDRGSTVADASHVTRCRNHSMCHSMKDDVPVGTCDDDVKPDDHHQQSPPQQQLLFLMKVSEQDLMADMTALILVPSLHTWLAFLEQDNHMFSSTHLWLRCLVMFFARIVGSFVAREIFAYKMIMSLSSSSSSSSSLFSSLSSLSALSSQNAKPSPLPQHRYDTAVMELQNRARLQRIMLADFYEKFGYLMAVTTICAFACFDKPGWPARYTFYTT